MAASTVLVAGAGAAGAAVLRPAPPAPGHAAAATGSAGGAGSGKILTSEQRQQAAAVPGAPQARLTVLAAQQLISAHTARAAARKAAARAARLAAQQQAAREAARQQAAQQAAAQPAPSSPPPSAPVPAGSAEQLAKAMLGSFGWSSSQFSCLDPLWEHESGWSVTASNPSGAYGIPQALPGSKMASAGADWETSAATQIRWGLGYIKGTYGSPCAAWAHEEAVGWY